MSMINEVKLHGTITKIDPLKDDTRFITFYLTQLSEYKGKEVVHVFKINKFIPETGFKFVVGDIVIIYGALSGKPFEKDGKTYNPMSIWASNIFKVFPKEKENTKDNNYSVQSDIPF